MWLPRSSKSRPDNKQRFRERVTADKCLHMPDLGGTARTTDVTAGVIDAIRAANV